MINKKDPVEEVLQSNRAKVIDQESTVLDVVCIVNL